MLVQNAIQLYLLIPEPVRNEKQEVFQRFRIIRIKQLCLYFVKYFFIN